jgi:DNA-binding NarL/FixJ family response regulator
LLARTVGRLSTARELLRDAIARTERLHAPVFTAIANTALDDLAGRAGPLTLRELEVARLVAVGLTNRRIADRLVLSERTVENHVSSILRKLGVATRSGIAATLG